MAKRQSSFTVPSSEVSRNLDNSTFDVVKIVSDNIDNVNYVGNSLNDVITVGSIHTEIVSLESIHNTLVSLYNDKTVLDSLYTDKVTLDSLFNDKEVLDSLYADKDKLDSIFSDKSKLDSIYTDLPQLESLYADKATLDSLFNDKVTLDRLHESVVAIDRLYASVSNIDTVADSIDNVDTVASNVIDISTTANNISDVSTIATNIQAVTTTSNNITSVQSIVDNMDEVTYFADIYQGPKDTQPSVRNDGSALQNGDLYFQIETDSLKAQMMEYDASNNVWLSVGSTVNGTSIREVFIATEGQTIFTITGGYDAGYADVYLNGKKLINEDDVDTSSGTEIVLSTPAVEGDILDVVAYGIFNIADHYTKAEADMLLSVKANLNGDVSQVFRASTAINDNDVVILSQMINEIIAKGVPTATIIAYSGISIPSGFLEVNGAELDIVAFSPLYSIIGTFYNTYALWTDATDYLTGDIVKSSVDGLYYEATSDGTSSGDDSDLLNGSDTGVTWKYATKFMLPDLRGEFLRGWDNGRGVDYGRNFGSWQTDSFRSHDHAVRIYSSGTNTKVLGAGDAGTDYLDSNPPVFSTGGDETRPRNIAVMYCIKY